MHGRPGRDQFPYDPRWHGIPVARAHGELPQPDGRVAFDPDHGRRRPRHHAEGSGQGILRTRRDGQRCGDRRHCPHRDREVAGRETVRSIAGVPEPHRGADGPHDDGSLAPRLHERPDHATRRAASERGGVSPYHEVSAFQAGTHTRFRVGGEGARTQGTKRSPRGEPGLSGSHARAPVDRSAARSGDQPAS